MKKKYSGGVKSGTASAEPAVPGVPPLLYYNCKFAQCFSPYCINCLEKLMCDILDGYKIECYKTGVSCVINLCTNINLFKFCLHNLTLFLHKMTQI